MGTREFRVVSGNTAVSLSQLQQQFTQDSAKLIQYAAEKGYAVTFAEAWRTPQQAQWDADHGSGISCSLHIQRFCWVTGKSNTGFSINCSVSNSNSVDWILIR